VAAEKSAGTLKGSAMSGAPWSARWTEVLAICRPVGP
jgi:hypothetical protein